MVLVASLSGAVTASVVEPPPSRHSAVTQPSSIMRFATWSMDAPTE